MVTDYKLTEDEVKKAYNFCKVNGPGHISCPGHDADPDGVWPACYTCPYILYNAHLAGV
jgi:hypothetical protein